METYLWSYVWFARNIYGLFYAFKEGSNWGSFSVETLWRNSTFSCWIFTLKLWPASHHILCESTLYTPITEDVPLHNKRLCKSFHHSPHSRIFDIIFDIISPLRTRNETYSFVGVNQLYFIIRTLKISLIYLLKAEVSQKFLMNTPISTVRYFFLLSTDTSHSVMA